MATLPHHIAAVAVTAALASTLTAADPAGGDAGTPAMPVRRDPGAERQPPIPPPDPARDIAPDRAPTAAEAHVVLQAAPVRPMRFPVAGTSTYTASFGACRDGCTRRHMGVDIFAPKLTHLLAANDGHVTLLRGDASGTAGNAIAITDAQGWRYLYLHVNNDSPGTDDGLNPARWRFASGLTVGTKVYAGQIIGYLGDSGNAETTSPHLHFELRQPDLVTIDPYPSLQAASRARPDPRLFRFDAVRTGVADDHVPWATTATSAIMGCDVDGDGDDEPVYRDGTVFVATASPTDLRAVRTVPYGRDGDRAVCGDWDGDGIDTPGVYRANLFMLRNAWSAGPAHTAFAFGRWSDRPVAGDWNGDGIDTAGVFRTGDWFLTNRHAGGTAPVSFRYGGGTDLPYPGDWNGDGDDTAGIRRGATAYYLRNGPGPGQADLVVILGIAGDAGLVGSWSTADVRGRDGVSVWRRYPR